MVQIWPGQTVTCLHTNSPGHIWTTLYIYQSNTGNLFILVSLHQSGFMSFWLFKSSVPVSRKIPLQMPTMQGFLSHQNMAFITVCMNILTFPWWDRTSVGQPSTSHYQEGIGEDRNMCRLVIIESALRLWRIRNNYVKSNQEVNRVSEFEYYFSCYSYFIFYLHVAIFISACCSNINNLCHFFSIVLWVQNCVFCPLHLRTT